mmetsp:Transcript_19688/g.42801  ORF Transcript_19688/g.42801 Transcript_19688/m.42801 type:complete len:88 (-) Transcript_19688:346-609(-)
MQFPTTYMFQVVGQPGASSNKEEFVRDMVGVVQQVCQVEVEEGGLEVAERLGGKYISLKINALVRAPEVIGAVFDKLEGDPRIKMKF